MKLAVISDIHGNLPALDAVLDDISRHAVDGILSLGDFLSGAFDPFGVADRLMALDLPSVRGNHDRFILDGRDNDWAIDALVRDGLSAAQRDWLASVPATARVGEVLLCHGTPASDTGVFLDGVHEGLSVLMPPDHIEREAAGYAAEVIVCGHSHVPRVVQLADGRLAVNPGSVGLPFDQGAPGAHYALIEKRRAGWSVNQIYLPYDREAAAALALARGFPKWAEMVTTGWTKPHEL